MSLSTVSGLSPPEKPVRVGSGGSVGRAILAGLGFSMMVFGLALAPPAGAEPLTLDRLVSVALAEDPGLSALADASSSEQSLALADASYPDPEVVVAAQNFPVDTFDFGQEPMTQYRIALRQSLPRGESRQLQRKRRQVRATQYELQARDRRASIVRTVSAAWVEALRDTRIVGLLKESEPLFAELERIARSAYAVGDGSQQDVVHAQLERLHLQDREILVQERLRGARVELSRWVGGLARLPLPEEPVAIQAPDYSDPEWEARLLDHPSVGILDVAVDERAVEVALAEQDYKPRFALEVAYGARGGEDMSGQSRPDFLSLGMTFDLPLFTANRQDRRVSAARDMQNAASSQRIDRIRQMQRDLDEALRQRSELQSRLSLYRDSILPASEQAALAALAGYRAAANDFAEVMRAHIALLDARIEVQTLSSGLDRNAVELGYLAGLEE